MPTFMDRFETVLLRGGNLGMRILGPVLCIAVHSLILLQFYAYIKVISPLLHMRVGTPLGVTWMIVGLVLCYNTMYNHFFAMLIKPGGPKE